MAHSTFMDLYDVEFMKSGFGISILGTNADGRSVSIPVETPLKEPTVPAPPLLPTTDTNGFVSTDGYYVSLDKLENGK